MKKILTLFVVLSCMITTPIKAQRHDKSVYNQVASMEFKQWKFNPENQYYSKVRKKKSFLGIKWSWDEPGLGWHDKGAWIVLTNLYNPIIFNPYAAAGGNFEAVFSPDNYVNEQWRQGVTQRTAATVEAMTYKDLSNTEREKWMDMHVDDIAIMSDREGVLDVLMGAKNITQTERDASIEIINLNYENIQDEKSKLIIKREYETLQEMVETIDDAHMDNAKKIIALEKINAEYKRLAELAETYHKLESIAADVSDITNALKKKKLQLKDFINIGLGVLDDIQVQQTVSLNTQWREIINILRLNWL